MKKILTAACLASLISTTAAFAASAPAINQSPLGNWYAGLHGGAAFLSGSDSGDFDTGYNIGAQVGYYIVDYFRLEGTYTFIDHSAKKDNDDVNMSNLMLNGIYNIYFTSPIVPYLGVGFGWAHFSKSGVLSNSNNEFAYQGIAGLGYKLTKNLTASIEYRALTWSSNNSHLENIVDLVLNYRF